MKKDYCTQNDGNCETCSLVNYGMDCRNNPIDLKASAIQAGDTPGIPDRIHQARAVVIFLSNAVGKMLEDADHLPNHEDNDFGADLIFQWLINEMQGILEALEDYDLVKREATQ